MPTSIATKETTDFTDFDLGQNSPTLTEMQEAFCQEYVLSGVASVAARKAGYSEATSRNAYINVLAANVVQKRVSELRKELKAEVVNRLARAAKVAVDVLLDIVKDENSPSTARVQVCNSLLDRAAYSRTANSNPTKTDLTSSRVSSMAVAAASLIACSIMACRNIPHP